MLPTFLTSLRNHTTSILKRGLTYFYEPTKGHGLPHDPFKSMVGPRPIAWVSTQDSDANVNLAPYSFYNAFNGNPPILGFSSEGFKNTVANINETGEFVVNMVSYDLAEKMNITSAAVPRGINEMELAKLTAVPSTMVKPPRVGESPVAFECKLLKTVPLTHDIDGNPLTTTLVLGQVVGVHINKQYIKDGIFDLEAANPILRAGSLGDYYKVGEKFTMRRPNQGYVDTILAERSPRTLSTIVEAGPNAAKPTSCSRGK